MDSLKERITYFRERKNISKSELSRIVGVSPAYITKLEYGEKTNPSLEILMKIAKALDVPVEEIQPKLIRSPEIADFFAGPGKLKAYLETEELEDQRGNDFRRVADLFEEFDYQISEINDNNIDKVEISTFEDGTIMTLEENDFINLGNQLLDEINESIRLQIKQFIKRNK